LTADVHAFISLLDLRENRRLRSNQALRRLKQDEFVDRRSPVRIDAHYLICAVDRAQPPLRSSEQSKLDNILATLYDRDPFRPSDVIPPGDDLNAWKPYHNDVIPLHILPAEGYPKLSDFWTSMGSGSTWHPAIYLIATVPLPLADRPLGPPVTTLTTDVGGAQENLNGLLPGSRERFVQIGGRVLRNLLEGEIGRPDDALLPVAEAFVALEARDGREIARTSTDELGRFHFHSVPGPMFDDQGRPIVGRYQLRVQAPRIVVFIPESSSRVLFHTEIRKLIDIPFDSVETNYDLVLPKSS
jgi:hypothetical protein